PAQPAVRPLAEAVGARLEKPTAYWEYLPSGRFGNRLVEGSVPGGSKALALNAVSLQGRCVGLRLPQFVQGLGGQVTAAAVFAKAPRSSCARRRTGWATVSTARFRSTYRSFLPLPAPCAKNPARLRSRGASSRRRPDEARSVLGRRLKSATRGRPRTLEPLGVGRGPRRGGSGDSGRHGRVHRCLPGTERSDMGARRPRPGGGGTIRDRGACMGAPAARRAAASSDRPAPAPGL